MYGDQSGEFVCGSWGLKGSNVSRLTPKGRDFRIPGRGRRPRGRGELYVFCTYSQKNRHPGKLYFTFFFFSTKKVNTELRLHKFSLITFFCPYRVWYRDTGHFIGFFSQPRLWHLPSVKSVPSTPVRPYDISEVSRHNQ